MSLEAVGAITQGVGAITGGILDAYNAEKARRQKERNRTKALNNAEDAYGQGLITLDQMKAAQGSILDANAQKAYKDMVVNTDWDAAGKVDFDKDSYNMDDYRLKNEGSILKGVTNAVKGSGAAAGSSWGSGILGNIASAAAEKQLELDKEARTAMNEDRNFDYTIAKDSASQRLNALQNKINVLGQAYTNDQQNTNDYYQSLLSLQQANATNKVNALLA